MKKDNDDREAVFDFSNSANQICIDNSLSRILGHRIDAGKQLPTGPETHRN